VAAELRAIAWWDWSREELAAAFEDLCGDARAFAAEYGSGSVAGTGEPSR
jgi:hypothetical protein